jgi:hypothetical protein
MEIDYMIIAVKQELIKFPGNETVMVKIGPLISIPYKYSRSECCEPNRFPSSTGISYGYHIDVSCDPVGYPSWMSYGCLQDVLMSSPMDVKRVYP